MENTKEPKRKPMYLRGNRQWKPKMVPMDYVIPNLLKFGNTILNDKQMMFLLTEAHAELFPGMPMPANITVDKNHQFEYMRCLDFIKEDFENQIGHPIHIRFVNAKAMYKGDTELCSKDPDDPANIDFWVIECDKESEFFI